LFLLLSYVKGSVHKWCEVREAENRVKNNHTSSHLATATAIVTLVAAATAATATLVAAAPTSTASSAAAILINSHQIVDNVIEDPPVVRPGPLVNELGLVLVLDGSGAGQDGHENSRREKELHYQLTNLD
jgi:hypothetical protein